jgi:cytochrome c oxidase accessory protein FixG
MIQPQYINGFFRKIKDYSALFLIGIYIFCSWIRWDRGADLPNQAILIDLPNRKAYLFWIQIWPDELYYLTLLLILAAMGLFFVTSLYGRIWCGFTCPHTVFVDLFVKVEHFFLGDRNSRLKFYELPNTSEKVKKLLPVHFLWLALGFLFAFGWVSYFYDAFALMRDIINLSVSTNGLIWLLGLTLSTYLFAGFIRQRVCIYMCPYGRFQSAMLDNDTAIVTYNHIRGEPRGLDKYSDSIYGDCIDCGKCVVVCPMGIDIRDGLQIECIGCGLCIDACDSVMNKLNREPKLINFLSKNNLDNFSHNEKHKKNIFRLKTTLFGLIFTIACFFIFYNLHTKAEYVVSIAHDRNALFTLLPDGSLRNAYTIKILNKTNKPLALNLSTGDGYQIALQGALEYTANKSIVVYSGHEFESLLYIKQVQNQNSVQNQIINVVAENIDDKTIITIPTKFMRES